MSYFWKTQKNIRLKLSLCRESIVIICYVIWKSTKWICRVYLHLHFYILFWCMAPDICAPYDVKFKGQHAEKGSVAVVCHAMLLMPYCLFTNIWIDRFSYKRCDYFLDRYFLSMLLHILIILLGLNFLDNSQFV